MLQELSKKARDDIPVQDFDSITFKGEEKESFAISGNEKNLL